MWGTIVGTNDFRESWGPTLTPNSVESDFIINIQSASASGLLRSLCLPSQESLIHLIDSSDNFLQFLHLHYQTVPHATKFFVCSLFFGD